MGREVIVGEVGNIWSKVFRHPPDDSRRTITLLAVAGHLQAWNPLPMTPHRCDQSRGPLVDLLPGM